jgi:hypothetical protein
MDRGSVMIHLKPLAMAALITQADTSRLDTTLMCMTSIYRTYTKASSTYDAETVKAIIDSLNKRWKKMAEKAAYILAVILNPYLRTDALDPQSKYRDFAEVWILFTDLYGRFFKGAYPPNGTRLELVDYLQHKGRYTAAKMFLQESLNDASSVVRLLIFWSARHAMTQLVGCADA